ncbi:MAG: D-alanyl-D-alanine carboxypeptidase family protein [Rhabdaerophilum calidifontis]
MPARFRRFTLPFVILAVLAGGIAAPFRPGAAPHAQERGGPERGGEKGAPFETSAKQAFLYDLSTRTILFARNAEQRIAPASLAKLMTATLVFRELKAGRLTLESEMVVSVDAWRRGGAVSGNPNMLLTPNKIVKVGELLTGLLVAGANDAALTLAENIAGREARFAEMMTGHARELGLDTLHFRNATGFAAEGQVATLRDLVRLAAHVIEAYPEYYPLFGQRDMPLGRNRQTNRNPLLAMEIGADGLMTGFLPETGQALIGSAVQEGRRLILGVAGLETVQERALESRKLIEWGFRRFEIRTLFAPGAQVGAIGVYGGAAGEVPLVTPREIRLPLLRGAPETTVLRLAWRGPVPAPVEAGARLARLEILVDGRVIQEAPLEAGSAVPQGGLLQRARDAAIEATRQGLAGSLSWLLVKLGLRSRPADPGADRPPAAEAGKRP